MHYEELIREHAPKWPYSVNYAHENEVSGDVLVLGGGIAGCFTAIAAAKKGARVVLVDKGATKTSGAGGAGVDHWQCAVTNPACKISPEEFTQALLDNFNGWRSGITTYIKCRESYDTLLDLENLGMKIRDSEDEFKGAEFRDDASKLLFAYDYSTKYTIRVWGSTEKQLLYKELKRLGVHIFDHVMVTCLLTEGGKQGARVVGATGVSSRTGEFYVFKGKASVLSMAFPQRQYLFSTELRGLSVNWRPPNMTGDGHAIAWMAGAEFVGAEESRSGYGGGGAMGYPPYGVGNADNTWFAAKMVDAKGQEIPWVDRDGRILKTVSERCNPAPGQKFFLAGGGMYSANPRYEYLPPHLMPTQGPKALQVTFPLYADLASMPENERRIIFGMMVAQEGKTLIPIYRTYTQAGFDPDKDMLQAYEGGWGGIPVPQWRFTTGGGLVIDWDLKTSLDGLYAAGWQTFSTGCHANAAVTGRYAGRHAAEYAIHAGEPIANRRQIEAEKARVYAPVQRENGMDWKELNAGVCRVMQDYCGEIKSEELLSLGLRWFDEMERAEAAKTSARNPHELMRVLEVFNIITNGKMIMEACRGRKASCPELGFTRSDYPQVEPDKMWVTSKLEEGSVKVGKLAIDYHGNLQENYRRHFGL